MKPLFSRGRSLFAPLACCLSMLAAPLWAHAAPVSTFVPYEGSGNISVFDATAGTGGWVGSLLQSPDPAVPGPLSLVSFVLFTLNKSAQTLAGNFEFTTTDLASSLFGQVTGSYLEADILTLGGQFSLDYSIAGGSGAFTGATGFGLAFVNFDPLGVFDNYTESGLLVFDVPAVMGVPEPGTLSLLAAALLGLVAVRRTGNKAAR